MFFGVFDKAIDVINAVINIHEKKKIVFFSQMSLIYEVSNDFLLEVVHKIEFRYEATEKNDLIFKHFLRNGRGFCQKQTLKN